MMQERASTWQINRWILTLVIVLIIAFATVLWWRQKPAQFKLVGNYPAFTVPGDFQ